MKHYVLGFAFNADQDYVVLINKNKPDWQKGSFNGVGGKIEEGEEGADAMAREFEEETGIMTKAEEWDYIGLMKGGDWDCQLFSMADDALMDAKTTTDEEISVFPVQEVVRGDYQTISNIPFLIELCRDKSRPVVSVFSY